MSNETLLLGERQMLIAQWLQRDGRVLAAELAVELGVSEDTIRRDLREMASSGLCRRVYGGALLPTVSAGSMADREKRHPERKEKLAAAAITLLRDGMSIFLDAGSTNLAIARAIPSERRLTVSTNAPAIAVALLEKPHLSVVQIGGQIDREVGGSIGAKALRDAEALRPDLCLLGVCGLDREAGVTAYGYEDAEFKRYIATRSAGLMVAVTSDKVAAAAPYRVLPFSRVTHAVFEADADQDVVDGCRLAGATVLQA